MNAIHKELASVPDGASSRGSVVEIQLLLESHLLADIEARARERGLTTASMVRCLIRDFVGHSQTMPAG